ncbi:acylsugar acyltransferase 3-like [Lycium ferocissimum]|uniref:acylsugar acyltransferase 3-like n=1 Tax=Lycium ferocissimum TaxID=112874 RepID=UPI002814CA52|nr:acylsugar acyltransferase 3-like [Lycium ferocissimum]
MVESTLLSQKIIKPSSPTPSSLRCHNLSFLDQITKSTYVPVASFYSKPTNYNIIQISHILENSLSKVLSSYYPFAGKIMNNKYVDCNDIGAEYFNVRVNCPMSKVLNNLNNDAIKVAFPQDLPWGSCTSSLDQSPLVVQLSHFDCGGIAVSVCISHKVADGYSLYKFLNDWAATARDDQLDFKPSPQFGVINTLYPPMDDPPPESEIESEPQQCVSRMFHFSSSNLGRLKDIVVKGSGVQNPTRVEVATALLHKCGVLASSTSAENHPAGMFKPSLLVHIMNLRPPLPLKAIGNAVSSFSVTATMKDEIHVPIFVDKLRKAKQHSRDKFRDIKPNQLFSHSLERSKEAAEMLKSNDIYFCSSHCNFGLYTIDFGWGRPIRVTPTSYPRQNGVIFLDDQSGEGINVLINLAEADMLIFQRDEELLEFASPIHQSPQ